MKRKIIRIDEEKCNGCGLCIPNCPEGAIQIIKGKARLVSELVCDGLGACLGHCPQGAITIEERQAKPYEEREVMKNIVKTGEEVIAAHLKHLKEHNENKLLQEAINFLKEKNIKVPILNEKKIKSIHTDSGCPGMKMLDLSKDGKKENEESEFFLSSQLRQWPIQLHLLNPEAPYFKDADLIIAADCVPFTCADFHRRFLKNKILIIFCPKLDQAQDEYVEKLAQIIKQNNIKAITTVHLEVPCCFGVGNIVEEALKNSGKSLVIKDYTISIKGELV